MEITRRGWAAHLVGLTIADVVIRNARLRWPIPKNLPKLLCGQTIVSLGRRAKYLLMGCGSGTLILHLGMSGSLRILPAGTPQVTAQSAAPGPRVQLETSLGTIVIELDPAKAPKTVENFLAWTAEPEMEARKRLGLKVMLFLLVLTGMLYALKRMIWSDLH